MSRIPRSSEPRRWARGPHSAAYASWLKRIAAERRSVVESLVQELLAQDVGVPAVLGELAQHVQVDPAAAAAAVLCTRSSSPSTATAWREDWHALWCAWRTVAMVSCSCRSKDSSGPAWMPSRARERPVRLRRTRCARRRWRGRSAAVYCRGLAGRSASVGGRSGALSSGCSSAGAGVALSWRASRSVTAARRGSRRVCTSARNSVARPR
jgi:hypothetical protein